MEKLIFVYTTFPDLNSAEKVIKKLIESKLVVCANIREHLAIYPWKGNVVKEKEIGVLIKTTKNLWNRLKEVIKREHPYEVPLIVMIEVSDVNKEYMEWVNEVLS